jgi:hypothetical protein
MFKRTIKTYLIFSKSLKIDSFLVKYLTVNPQSQSITVK